jgi:hypothetical protein
MSNGTGLICSSVKENLAAAEKTRHDQQQQLAHKKAELARKTKTRKELKDATADAIENADIAEQKAQESTATKEKLVSDHQRLVKRKNDSETKMIENEATLRERKLAHSTLQQQHAIDLEGSITEHVQARQALESWLVNALAASSHDGLRGGVRRASKEKAQAAPSLVELNSALQLVTQIARLEAEIAKSRGTAQVRSRRRVYPRPSSLLEAPAPS